MLSGQLDEQAIKQISSKLGVDDQTAQQAVNAALPMLMGAVGRNAASEDGAQSLSNALQKDHHDGRILNDLPGAMSNPDTMKDGQAILGHLLGGKQANVETGIAKTTGLNAGSAGQLLSMLAPVVLGAVGQQQQQQGLDVGGLMGMLQGERQQSDDALSGLSQLLDMDGDGDITDDVLNLGSKLLGGFFGGGK
jgi:hypothetical protein